MKIFLRNDMRLNSSMTSNNISSLIKKLIFDISITGIFNPWDRALYLSVANDRPFLHRLNFASPMNGVFQTIFQRGISAGLYFPLEEIFTSYLKETFQKENISGSTNSNVGTSSSKVKFLPNINETGILLCAGLMAGAGNGFIMNPISSIKYHFWGLSGGGVGFKGGEISGVQIDGKKNTFFTVAIDMFRRGGFRPFFVGVNATIGRDVIFGGAFAYLRYELPKLSLFNPDCSENISSSTILSLRKMSDFFFSSSILSTSLASGLTVTNTEIGDSSISTSMFSSSSTIPQQRQHQEINRITASEKIVNPSSQSKSTFLTDLLSGLVATTLSSPLNYVRNIHYSLPPDVKPDSTLKVLNELWMKSMEEKSFMNQLKHLQSRLRLGWGTARVGCGMALASQFYIFIKSQL